MDRIARLTEQLRLRQPGLPEEDFRLLDDAVFPSVGLGEQNLSVEDEIPNGTSIQDMHLKLKPINVPPNDGFSKSSAEDYGTEIDPNFLCKLDCVVSGHLKPVVSVNKADFVFELKKHLNDKKFKSPTTCQSYMWSAIIPGKSVCCVGPPKIGKTGGYLLPLITASITFRQLQEKNGHDCFIPYSLVLCPHGKSVRKVATEAIKWTPKGPRKPLIKVVCCDKPSAFRGKSRQADLLNGPDILITTPSLFLKLNELKLVSIRNCQNLIFDEADELFLIHTEESQSVHALYIQNNHQQRSKSVFAESIRAEDSLNSQVVICSESYSRQVRHVLDNFIKRPVTIMSDKVEEAIQARIECDVKFCSDSKAPSLLDLIISDIRYEWAEKIIICCKDHEESIAVGKILKDKVYCQVLSEESKHFNLPEVKKIWKSRGKKVLIIDDEVLLAMIATIQIDDANCLIHYSIPEVKGKFASRFIFMQSSLKSQVRCSTAIFVDPTNRKQAHELVLLIKKLDAVVPQGLIDLRNTFPRGLCQSFAAFGKCPLMGLNCYYDHFCNSSNAVSVNNEPQVGQQVKFIVTSVRSANLFYARIKSYRNAEDAVGTWIDSECSQEYILKELQSFDDADDCLLAEELTLGQVCAIHHVFDGKRQVHRIRIEEFRDGIDENSNYIKVYHIDHGFETMAKRSDLIKLPTKWSQYPPFAVKCYIVKCRPSYNEPEWDQSVNQTVLDALRRPEVSYLTGWISHVYNSCYWIEEVNVYHQLPSLKSHLKAYKLMDLILKTDSVTEAERPSFCTDLSSLIENSSLKWKVENQKKISSLAFISDQHDYYHLIWCDDETAQVFIRHAKFEKQLENLEKELRESTKKPISLFHEGLIGFCEYDKVMNRIMVKKIKNNGSIDVFFVDHGEVMEVDKKSCFEIEDKYITRLPFQAIKVQLAAEITSWNPDRIYDLTREAGEIFKNLLVEKRSSGAVYLFVPVNETESKIVYDELMHLAQNVNAELSEAYFDVEKIVQKSDTDSEDEEMGPEEREAKRAMEEILLQRQRSYFEQMGILHPDGGQIPTEHNRYPEPVINGVDDDQDDKQVIALDRDAPEFDYTLPPGVEPLPYDDMDDEEDAESDDEIELKSNDDIDTFFEKID